MSFEDLGESRISSARYRRCGVAAEGRAISAAIAARAAALDVVGGDIDDYRDKIEVVAEAGIFDKAALARVIADRIAAWGLADEPRLAQFISS